MKKGRPGDSLSLTQQNCGTWLGIKHGKNSEKYVHQYMYMYIQYTVYMCMHIDIYTHYSINTRHTSTLNLHTSSEFYIYIDFLRNSSFSFSRCADHQASMDIVGSKACKQSISRRIAHSWAAHSSFLRWGWAAHRYRDVDIYIYVYICLYIICITIHIYI